MLRSIAAGLILLPAVALAQPAAAPDAPPPSAAEYDGALAAITKGDQDDAAAAARTLLLVRAALGQTAAQRDKLQGRVNEMQKQLDGLHVTQAQLDEFGARLDKATSDAKAQADSAAAKIANLTSALGAQTDRADKAEHEITDLTKQLAATKADAAK